MNPTAQPDPTQIIDTVNALVAKDWHLAVAGGIGLLAFLLRYFIGREKWPWLHTPIAVIAFGVLFAGMGAAVPALDNHASWKACLSSAGAAMLVALVGMVNPSGAPVQPSALAGTVAGTVTKVALLALLFTGASCKPLSEWAVGDLVLLGFVVVGCVAAIFGSLFLWRIRHLAIAFGLLAGAAHADPLGFGMPGTALDPHGPGWQATQPKPADDPGVRLAQAPTHAELPSVSVAPQVQVPPTSTALASDVLAARLDALEKIVADDKKALGVPDAPQIPRSFWDKPAGIALTIAFTLGTMALSAAGSYATIAAAGK